MENNTEEPNYENVKFDVENIVKELENATEQKAHKDKLFNNVYLIGNITEDNLLDLGFKCYGLSNKSGYETYLYRLGNIEAIFVDQVVHISEITA